ncbi:MAG: hypothetical protein ACLFOY_16580 [Desulfatibacillaceae bacterium]
MPNSWITHKGKRILFVDYRGEDQETMYKTVDGSTEIIRNSKRPVLVLSDATGCLLTPEFISHASRQGATVEHNVPRAAIIGISVIMKAMIIGYNRGVKQKGFKPFETREEALDWLVK